VGVIRPVLTNFKLGEVDPRLAGRTDLGLAIGAAEKIENAHTYSYGGVYKRGGLEYKGIIEEESNGKCRIIPWSIDDDTDFLVILLDKRIRFYFCGNGAHGFLTEEITNVGWNGLINTVYSIDDIYDVQYVTDKNVLYMVHRNYPPMFIRMNKTDTGYSFTYGGFSIASVLAISPELSKAQTTSNLISSETVISLLKEFVSDFSQTTEEKEFTVSDGLSGQLVVNGNTYSITKIKIIRSGYNRYAQIIEDNIIINDTTPDFVTSNAVGIKKYCGTDCGREKRNTSNWWPWDDYEIECLYGIMNEKINIPATTVNFLNFCQRNMVDGKKYIIAHDPESAPDKALIRSYVVFRNTKRLYTVEFYRTENNDFVKMFSMQSDATSTVPGWFDITNYKISVNGTKSAESDVNDVIDSIAPWLFSGKIYECVQSYQFCGKTPKTIQKSIEDGVPTLLVTFTDNTQLHLKRGMIGVNGRLAVRLNPIIETTDFPGCIAIWQGRLCLAGSRSLPNVVFMSKVNSFFDFTFFEDVEYTSTVMKPEEEWDNPDTPEYETITKKVQQTAADSAIQFAITTEENEEIKGLCAGGHLFISTTTSEFIVPAGTTALNLSTQIVSRNGGSKVQPRLVQNIITYVGQSKRKLFTFSPEQQIDLFTYAKHIIEEDVIQFDYKSDPDFGLFITLANGTVLYGIVSEGTFAWQKYKTDGKILSCAVIRAKDEDAVYMAVERYSTIYLERLKTINSYEFENRPYLDCYQYLYSASNIETIERESILLPNGVTVRLHYQSADGTEGELDRTLEANTNITIPAALNVRKVYIGLPYVMKVYTWRIDTSDTEGLAKNVEAIYFRLFNSSGFNIRKDAIDVFRVDIPDYDGIDTITYSGIIKYNLLSPWDLDKNVMIESADGYPVNILNIMPQLAIGDVV